MKIDKIKMEINNFILYWTSDEYERGKMLDVLEDYIKEVEQ